ncbi:MAG: rod shape-determining protein MreD [Lachnospiraceae bacterium]|nr:rod shape-determining protein MreD [Lachnospiraceae bacterium]
MLRKVILTLIIFFGFIFQCSVLNYISLGGIVPNILLIITASFGFMRGQNEGMAVGFLCGILVDIFFGNVFGFYTICYVLIGYLNGFFKNIFYPEDIKLPLLLITVSEIVYCMICYIFRFLLRGRLAFGYYFVHIILPEIVYTILATLLIYKGIVILNEWLEDIERRNA